MLVRGLTRFFFNLFIRDSTFKTLSDVFFRLIFITIFFLFLSGFIFGYELRCDGDEPMGAYIRHIMGQSMFLEAISN